MERREFLVLSTAGVALLAGCNETDSDGNSTDDGNGDNGNESENGDNPNGDENDTGDQDTNDGDDSENDDGDDGGENNDGGEVEIEGEFDEAVLELLLTADQIPGDWETTDTPDGGVSSPRAVASQARVLESSEGEEITLGMTLFDAPVGAEEYLGVRANRLADQGATVTQEDLGDQAQSITSEGRTAFDVRLSNVTILVIGDIDVSRLQTIAEAQLTAIQ